MRQKKALTFLSAALGSAVVATFSQIFKPSSEQDPVIHMAARYAEPRQTSQDGDVDLSKPIFKDGCFENPWDTWKKRPGFFNFFKMACITANESGVPSSQEELDRTLPIETPNMKEFEKSPESGVRMMWVGHATVVAQLDGMTVITDPVFSQRCAPVQFIGPKRYRDPPCSVEELPKLDAVLISHNHYDHLDCGTVTSLNKRFGRDLRWFVPMGLKSWMNEAGCENVVEMTWWDEVEIKEGSDVRVACTPCQHWCKRGARDDNKVLWSSWCVMGPKNSFHFSGDTGLCKGFEQIGRKYGPFTAAAIPIGAYHPRWFMGPQHVDPEQAVQIHCDVKAKQSIGIHWGTFVLTYEPYMQPKQLLGEEVEKKFPGRPPPFVTVNHGAIGVFGADS